MLSLFLLDFSETLQQSGCASCGQELLPDSRSWVPVNPRVSAEEGVPVFDLHSTAGQHQCTKSGLRWVCDDEVTLRCMYVSWGSFRTKLSQSHYRPIGPLIDITVRSGKLKQIHLPHFVCLGGSDQTMQSNIRIMHKLHEEVIFETCIVSQCHAQFLPSSFSPMGPVAHDHPDRHIFVHSKLLHFRPSSLSPIQRTYLIPNDSQLEEKVRAQENRHKSIEILLPGPGKPLQMGELYHLSAKPISTVMPLEMELVHYDATPNFYRIQMKMPVFELEMKLKQIKNKKCVWTVCTHKDDFCPAPALEHELNKEDAVRFFDKHRSTLIQTVTDVMSIADDLYQQGVINTEKYSTIREENTNQSNMRRLCNYMNTANSKVKFFEILKKHDSQLVDSLNEQ